MKTENQTNIFADKFEALCAEQDQIYMPEFEAIFTTLFKSDKQKAIYNTNVWNIGQELPDEIDQEVINKAIAEAGYCIGGKIANNFTRYVQIVLEGKKMQQAGVLRKIKEMPEPQPSIVGGWQFVPMKVYAPDTMQDSIKNILIEQAKEGKGLFENITNVMASDESLDEFLNVEVWCKKVSLQLFLEDLRRFNIETVFQNIGGEKVVIPIIKSITDFIDKEYKKPNKVKNYTSKIIKAFDAIPVWGLFYQILILEGLYRWCEGATEKADYDKIGNDDIVAFGQWIIKIYCEKLIQFSYTPYGDGDKETLVPFCEFLCNTELGKEVQCLMFPPLPELPPQLNTQKAEDLFNRAVEAGIMTVEATGYKWNRTKQLCAYFVEQASEFLNLTTRQDKDGNIATCWKPFEILFGVNKLKDAKQNWMRVNTKFEPTGYQEIKRLFK